MTRENIATPGLPPSLMCKQDVLQAAAANKLEVVNVDEQHRRRATVAPGSPPFFVKPTVQNAAVA